MAKKLISTEERSLTGELCWCWRKPLSLLANDSKLSTEDAVVGQVSKPVRNSRH